jgi:hypothetical protein
MARSACVASGSELERQSLASGWGMLNVASWQSQLAGGCARAVQRLEGRTGGSVFYLVVCREGGVASVSWQGHPTLAQRPVLGRAYERGKQEKSHTRKKGKKAKKARKYENKLFSLCVRVCDVPRLRWPRLKNGDFDPRNE